MKKILIIILILIFPIVALAADLFSDGFESGDFSAWDWDAGGDLTVSEAAALHGTYGMSLLIDDETILQVQETSHTTNETRYRCRFYFDPNDVAMDANDQMYIMISYNDSAQEAFFISFNYIDSLYKIRVHDYTDGTYSKYSAFYTITNEPHCIEVDWQCSTGIGNNDGEFTLWIDGVLKENVTGIDSDTESVGDIRLGGIAFYATGILGTIYFDDFASNDDGTLIGQIVDNAIIFGTNF